MSKLNPWPESVKHQRQQSRRSPNVPEGSVSIDKRYSCMLGERTELVIRRIKSLLPQPQRTKGWQRRCFHSSAGQLGRDEPFFEDCVVRANDRAVQTWQNVGYNVGKQRGIPDSIVADSVNKSGAGVAAFRIQKCRIFILDATVLFTRATANSITRSPLPGENPVVSTSITAKEPP